MVFNMVIEKAVEKALFQLAHDTETQISVGHFHVDMRIFDGASKMSLSTPVYVGENYIPRSVRGCLAGQAPFSENTLNTFLTVEEATFRVILHYVCGVEKLDHIRCKVILEDFARTADMWCDWLDDHDKRDLVYVRK